MNTPHELHQQFAPYHSGNLSSSSPPPPSSPFITDNNGDNTNNRSTMSNNGTEQQDLIDFLTSPIPSNDSGINHTENDVDDIRNTRKQRIIKNSNSPARRNSKRLTKSKSDKNGILDNPQIAPPPTLPPFDDRVKVRYESNAEHEADYMSVPIYEKIRHSGEVMTRFSAFSLLTKKWRSNFWILYGEVLYFFRSKDDFEEWLINPYLSREGRSSFVKRYLNFKDDNAKNFIVGKIGTKYYRNQGLMYHFKLDKYYVRGPHASLHLVGAFSSMNESDIIELHAIFKAMLKQSPDEGSLHFGAQSDTYSAHSSSYPYSDGYNSTASAGF